MLQTTLRLLLFIRWQIRLFFLGKITVKGDKLFQTAVYGAPREVLFTIVASDTESDAFRIMVYKTAAAVKKGMGVTADTVFLFQKGKRVLLRVKGLIKLIYAVLSISEARAAHKFVIQVGLRNGKGGGLFSLRLLD